MGPDLTPVSLFVVLLSKSKSLDTLVQIFPLKKKKCVLRLIYSSDSSFIPFFPYNLSVEELKVLTCYFSSV